MPLGIYIHIPFCEKKCDYCAFYSSPATKGEREGYCRALERHIRGWGEQLGKPAVDTVFFGGGTPSLVKGQLSAIMDSLRQNFALADDCEVTLEANPGTLAPGDFDPLLKAGINRLSLGVQAATNEELQTLGRIHTVAQAEDCALAAKAAGFTNLSLDFMLGIPGQTWESLSETFAFAERVQPTHLSYYGLKVEEGTPFYLRRDELVLPDEDDSADWYEWTVEKLAVQGFAQYEVSNFARPGFTCRHNLRYWRMEDYLGIGPAAHSLLKGKRFYYPESRHAFEGGDRHMVVEEGLADSTERCMLALRTADGLSLDDPAAPAALADRAKPYEKAGLLTTDGGRVRLTAKGYLVSTPLIASLLFGENT